MSCRFYTERGGGDAVFPLVIGDGVCRLTPPIRSARQCGLQIEGEGMAAIDGLILEYSDRGRVVV